MKPLKIIAWGLVITALITIVVFKWTGFSSGPFNVLLSLVIFLISGLFLALLLFPETNSTGSSKLAFMMNSIFFILYGSLVYGIADESNFKLLPEWAIYLEAGGTWILAWALSPYKESKIEQEVLKSIEEERENRDYLRI